MAYEGRKTGNNCEGGARHRKSVIALNLMASLLRDQKNARYATGSKAFTETLKKVLGPRAAVQFDWTMSYAQAAPDSVDVVIVDEAHRIRLTSNARWVPKARQSGIPQVQEILRAARIAVFFVDDLQGVRPSDVGTSTYIRSNADSLGIPVREFQLDIQFRCKGSESFVQWIDSTLGLAPGPSVPYSAQPGFDFRIVDSPQQLESLIRSRAAEGSTSRVAAGFCWKWSRPRQDGTLVPDVELGEYRRPWNAGRTRGAWPWVSPRHPSGVPETGGIDQVGCVYTAQGFEFDYVGVLVGPDLQPSPDGRQLHGLASESYDPALPSKDSEMASNLIRRAYRVLLSRGIEGCYVYFADPATRQYFESRMAPD